MKRKISAKLIAWKLKKGRKPLIIQGARQVGKTFIINEFGHEYFSNIIYINFEADATLSSVFNNNLSPTYLLNRIEIYFNKKIDPENTLIFFDEIQANERALSSLKYFCENAPEYYIIAAGSLLGVMVNRENYSFPVGKVEFLTLFSMDFEEFLWANSQVPLSEEIRKHYYTNSAFDMHNFALELYNDYLIIGGMPAVVSEYLKEKRMIDIIPVQGQIINSYIADMAKYATPHETSKIMMAYNSIPAQLAKDNRKFQYKVIQKGGSSSLFGATIDWLTAAGVVLKCNKIEKGEMPLAAYQNLTSFKLYMSDVGLLTHKSGISMHIILSPNTVNNPFTGSLAENYVANMLVANGFPLYYWTSEDIAEIDFVIQCGTEIIPIEVKANINVRSRSISVYKNKFHPPYTIRISGKNFGFENDIKSVPLYAAFCIGNLEQ